MSNYKRHKEFNRKGESNQRFAVEEGRKNKEDKSISFLFRLIRG
jgi:hypothetical protein